MMWEFSVPGVPVAMPRPRWCLSAKFRKAVSSRQWGTVIHMASNPGSVVQEHVPRKKLRPYQDSVRIAARAAGTDIAPRYTPVRVDVRAVFPRPKARPHWCPKGVWSEGTAFVKVTRPDADNCYKTVADALEGVAYHDDGQLCRGSFIKAFAAKDDEPHTTIIVTHLDLEDWVIGY